MHKLLSIVLVVLVALVSPVYGQTSHTAPAAALDAAVQDHVASRTADREAVLRLLARPEVREIAGNAGIELRRAEQAVATMDDAALADVAAQARQAEQALAGGQSRVTLSTTMIIIVLLVLILLIVAID